MNKEGIQDQIDKLSQGMHRVHVDRPAIPGDGIYVVSDKDKKAYAQLYHHHLNDLSVVKFVPASGAASRMFKELHSALHSRFINAGTMVLLDRLDEFPFYDDLRKEGTLAGIDIDRKKEEGDFHSILQLLLGSEHLGLADLPKGLLDFHRYEEGNQTAFEEHLKESFAYATGKDGLDRLHFTISEEHRSQFDELLDEMREKYREKNLDVSFSYQHSETDTIALGPDGEPVLLESGELLQRPGGHGSLLKNLNEIDGELVFLKNIDNIQPERLHSIVAGEKMALGGMCLAIREEVHELIGGLKAGEGLEDRGSEFIRKWFIPNAPDMTSEELITALDRPLRVCGMVVNEGEPGGGPFWVDGRLQIVEKSQIDDEDEEQLSIMKSSTHFNPVDLVCSITNPEGNIYDLNKFVDEDAYITTEKSFEGREIRVLEHPGLWNGAMAGWNTIFVEVPAFTFSPVKTVFDLLRKAHQV